MAQTSSSQDLRSVSASQSRSGSKSRMKKDKGQQAQALRITASFTSVENMQVVRPNSLQFMDVNTCPPPEPPVKEPFFTRNYKGKMVRDVLIDTHDLLNEPGGFVINLTHHGEGSEDSNEMSIHLGIKEKYPLGAKEEPFSGMVQPGTITTTDDYAREIFRAIRSSPQLDSITAILEVNDNVDNYDEKIFSEIPSNFLQKFIQTYPTTLTKLHVEMPGISPTYLPEWKFLLDQQLCLKILICNFGVVLWTFYENCIAQNSDSLERIILRRLQTYDFKNGTYIPLNWSIFSECVKLAYLKVTCGYKYKHGAVLTLPQPPSSVFLHENFDELPKQETFEELHLGNIWVNQCILESFCTSRPNLKFCSPCNDKEYYDDGDKENVGSKGFQLQLVSVSMIDVQAEMTQSVHKNKSQRRTREKQFTWIVLALFHIILMSLAILFIIIYFRHLRNSRQKDNKIV